MFAKRMDRLGTETAFEVLAKAKALEAQGRDIVHLEIGEPDFDTPDNIRKAAEKAIWQGYTHYGPSAGLMEARKAVCEYFAADRGIEYEPDQIVLTPGGKPVIFLPILALVDHGDEVIYPNPGYPIYESAINFAGGKAVPLVYREERDFRFDMAELEAKINPKTKMLILNSPANPTGGILEESDLKRIAELCVKNDVVVLSDEVYCKIIYEGKHHSIATYPGMKERTILMDAHSKTYAMTGWRLGFAAMPKPIAERFTKLNTNVYSHATTFVQLAGIEALKGPQDKVKEMVATFDKRRKAIVAGMNSIKGWKCLMPKGAFYVFPNITGTGMKSKELADKLLNEAGVACLAGTCFGAHGEGFLRFSYANSLTNIEKALDRIKGVLAHQ
ncbi:MAG: pyridoxal phosphate-dependent aminotransferase [Candidatus Eisenbacteria bacterium]|nr:pyridoxal phosphate-dependent aminotransferase [Candidatus Eisenbacteria bacterium]